MNQNTFKKSQSSIKRLTNKSFESYAPPCITSHKKSRISEETPKKFEKTNYANSMNNNNNHTKKYMSQSLLLNNNNSDFKKLLHQDQHHNTQSSLKQKLVNIVRQKTQDKGDIHTTFMENSKKNEIETVYKTKSIYERFLIQEKEIIQKQERNQQLNSGIQLQKNKNLTEEDKQLIQCRKRAKELQNTTKNLALKISQKLKQVQQNKRQLEDFQYLKMQQEQLYTQKLLLKSQQEIKLNKILQQLREEKDIEHVNSLKKQIEQFQQNQEKLRSESDKTDQQISELQNSLQEKQKQLSIQEENGEKINLQMEQAMEERDILKENSEKRKMEFLQRKRELKILQEQIFFLKKQPRNFCISIPKLNIEAKGKSIFDYESYFKPLKSKNINTNNNNSNSNGLQLLKNDRFKVENKANEESKSKSAYSYGMYQQQSDMYRFEVLIERQKGQKQVHEGLFQELEMFFKGFLYKRMSLILGKLSSNSQEFSHIYDLQKQDNLNKSTLENVIKILQDKKQLSGINQQQQNGLQNSLVQQIMYQPFILMMGDKNRGTLQKIIEYTYNMYNNMENDLIKVQQIHYCIQYLDTEHREDFLSYSKLLTLIQGQLSKDIYNKNILITCQLEIQELYQQPNQQFYQQYKKNLNIIMLNFNEEQQNQQILIRQFKQAIKKEVIPNKLKVIEAIEMKIRGIDKFIQILELPELIQIGDKTAQKYTKIKNVLDVYQQICKK